MLSAAARAIYEGVNLCSDTGQFDEILHQLWNLWGEHKITDEAAGYLSSIVERRRTLRRTVVWYTKPLDRSAGRLFSRFTSRQRQRSPDRKASRDRRRRLGGSSEGQRSVLCIVSGEVKRCGLCDFPVDKIAALAGVCRTTVQTALHVARRLGHITITERPQPGRKNLPNLVEIISPKWRKWIQRAPSTASLIGSNSAKMANPTKNTDSRKNVAEEDKASKLAPRAVARPGSA